jgi:hypothetical protein
MISADRTLASIGNHVDWITRILGRRRLTSEDSKDAIKLDRSAEMDVDLSSRSSDGGGPRGMSAAVKNAVAGGGSVCSSGRRYGMILSISPGSVPRASGKAVIRNRTSRWTNVMASSPSNST